MLDATRHWLREKAEKELTEARSELARATDELRAWCYRSGNRDWEMGFYDIGERIDCYSELRHDARGKVRFLRSVVIELGGKP